MKRRNFISILAGLAAVPAAIKGLFGKTPEVSYGWGGNIHSVQPNMSPKESLLPDAVYIKEVHPIEGRTAVMTFQEEITGLPTYGDHKLPESLRGMCI